MHMKCFVQLFIFSKLHLKISDKFFGIYILEYHGYLCRQKCLRTSLACCMKQLVCLIDVMKEFGLILYMEISLVLLGWPYIPVILVLGLHTCKAIWASYLCRWRFLLDSDGGQQYAQCLCQNAVALFEMSLYFKRKL